MRNPPILIAVLGFFAALAGFSYLFFGLQVLGFDWFGALGDLPRFEQVGLWGWLAILVGIIWLAVAFGLWALQPWARIFAIVVAGISLLEALLAIVQFTGSGIGFGMAILPLLLLWYLNTAEVKAAFADEPEPSAAEPEPEAMPAAAVAMTQPEEPPAAPVAAAAAVATSVPEPEPAATDAVPPAEDAPEAPSRAIRIEDVEGIGPAYRAKLAESGISTTDALLAAGSTRAGRQRIAQQTGISDVLILEWVKNADLMRVPGVGAQYSDLLEAAGVDSPAELANRNAANLAQTFQELVAARPGTVRRIPTESEVAGWIGAAAELPKVVEH